MGEWLQTGYTEPFTLSINQITNYVPWETAAVEVSEVLCQEKFSGLTRVESYGQNLTSCKIKAITDIVHQLYIMIL